MAHPTRKRIDMVQHLGAQDAPANDRAQTASKPRPAAVDAPGQPPPDRKAFRLSLAVKCAAVALLAVFAVFQGRQFAGNLRTAVDRYRNRTDRLPMEDMRRADNLPPVPDSNWPGSSGLPRLPEPPFPGFFARVSGPGEALPSSTMLQGVFYDLKRTRDGRTAPGFETFATDYMVDREEKFMKTARPFAKGKWLKEYDKNGLLRYPELDGCYRSPVTLWSSFFLVDQMLDSAAAVKGFCGGDARPGAWLCLYSGVVEAPFTGDVRFVGTCDDVLVVRFNGRVVFDYGRAHVISREFTADELKPKFYGGATLGAGETVSVEKGRAYPVDVMFADVDGGQFTIGLFCQTFGPQGYGPLTVFRTAPEQPERRHGLFDDWDAGGYVWKPVDPVTVSAPAASPR